jgi:YgiT-type zinc finger domain-containing protein
MRKPSYGDCVFCGGDIHEVKDKVVYEHHGQVFIFEDVAFGRCGQCGERFLKPKMARKLETLASAGGRRATTVAEGITGV